MKRIAFFAFSLVALIGCMKITPVDTSFTSVSKISVDTIDFVEMEAAYYMENISDTGDNYIYWYSFRLKNGSTIGYAEPYYGYSSLFERVVNYIGTELPIDNTKQMDTIDKWSAYVYINPNMKGKKAFKVYSRNYVIDRELYFSDSTKVMITGVNKSLNIAAVAPFINNCIQRSNNRLYVRW